MRSGMKGLAVAAGLALALLSGSSASALRLPAARNCPVFPASNAWNQRVDELPVAADSAQLIASIGLDSPVHADFGSGRVDGGPIGLPIFPGLARWDEVARGVIDHALRFTAPRTRRAYVYPARHYASTSSDPSLPPMGLRVRLRASVNVSAFPRQARVVLRALQRYGMILADNGSPWYVSGAPNRHWSNDGLHTLGRLTGADFEVVDTSSLPEPGK